MKTIKSLIRKACFLFQRIALFFWLEIVGLKKYKTNFLETSNIKTWFRNFKRMALHFANTKYLFTLFNEFLKSDIQIEKNLGFKDNLNLIAICVIRNDIEKLKIFLEHHRKLGITQFAFLDDKSTDGTKEFLLAQNDVELFKSSQDFQSIRKVAWINNILAYYDFNRWYLVMDSDELLVYDNFENKSIIQFINSLEKENMSSASGMMVDMYKKDANFSRMENANIYDGVDYFDKNGYFSTKNSIISGGVRYRCLGVQQFLEKTPLFCLDDKTVYLIHDIFPLEKNFQQNKKTIALLHYKFLSGDIEKYKERIERKAMANDSKCYKQYMEKIEKNNIISFYDENISEKFIGSDSLIKHNLLEKI